MNKTFWQSAKPHLIAILVFLAVSVFFCLPAFQGKVVNQHDIVGWKGMAQQSIEFKEKHGHYPLWTQSTFSGMPAFQILMESHHNVTLAKLDNIFRLFLPAPASLFFLSCIGFYILAVVLGMRPWIGVLGGLAYAFATYNAALVAAGHVTKIASMGYAPTVLAGLILLAQRKYVLGFLATLLFTTCLLYQGHVQVVFYTFLTAGCLGVAFVIHAIRKKEGKPLLIALGAAIIAVALSAGSYAVALLPTSNMAKETMRGGRSELTDTTSSKENKTVGGLDKDYAFAYSVGIGESMNVLLPHMRGGSSGAAELPEDGKAVEALQDAGLPGEVANQFFGMLSAYWGEQPGVGGPPYLGVLICVLAVASLFVVRRNWHIGWLVAASIIGFVLAWGSNLKGVNYFLFDHLPFYNKFRAPSIALIIPQLTFSVLACLALQEIFYREWDKKELLKKLKYAGIAIGLIAVLLIGHYFSADFKSSGDNQLKMGLAQYITQIQSRGQQPTDEQVQQGTVTANSIINGLVSDRKGLYGSDLLKFFVYLVLGAGLVWVVVQKKLKPDYAVIALAVLLLIDLIPVDRKYLNDNYYVDKEEMEAPLQPIAADLQIKQDTSYYRVFDQTGDPFQSSNSTARCSYNHNSVGGYNPAKLALYDDLIKHQLTKGNIEVFNMLNTKYFIGMDPASRQPVAQRNPGALGPVWFVKSLRYVNNADEEMKALDNLQPRDTAVLDKREQGKVSANPQFDSMASIRIVQNLNDKLTYESNAATNQFAVFSEIYYPNGWKAYVDGKEVPIVKVNYLLRGLPLAAGKHNIEFRFEPTAFVTGDRISLIAGIISIVLLLAGIVYLYRNSAITFNKPAPKV